MTRTVTTWLRGLLVALALVCLAGSSQAQPGALPFDPTHYWTYHILDPIPVQQPIFARDQFFRQGVPLTVANQVRLLNWVHKNNSAVTDTILHYTWYDILEKIPVNKAVIVSNQFGSFPVEVVNLEFLLTPTLKNQTALQLPQANHYLCYRATGFPAPPLGYDFVDEWRVDFQHPQAMEFLCAPCVKQHLGVTYPVVDTVTHLAVYPITPTSDYFVPILTDQFAPHQHIVQQIPLEYLFVPSEKTERPTDVRRNTWGRVKQLYR